MVTQAEPGPDGKALLFSPLSPHSAMALQGEEARTTESVQRGVGQWTMAGPCPSLPGQHGTGQPWLRRLHWLPLGLSAAPHRAEPTH